MKRMILAVSLTIATLAHAQPSAGQWCPVDPVPECNDDGTSCKNSCDSFGDPVTIVGVNSFHKVTDISLETGKGPLFFSRSYTSGSAFWSSATDPILSSWWPETPRPFAGFSGTDRRLQWWHNLFSFVAEKKSWSANTFQVVQYSSESGTRAYFQDPQSDGGAGRWLRIQDGTGGSNNSYSGSPLRLQRMSNGVSVVRPDGRVYEYAARYEQSTGSADRLYFLSTIRDAEGSALATLSYLDPPGLSCPKGNGGGSSPYLSQLTLATGHILTFRWARASTGPADRRCYLASIGYAAPGASPSKALATFSYDNLGSGVVRLASAVNGSDGGEAYTYGSNFVVSRLGAGPFVNHSLDAGPGLVTALESYSNGPKLTQITILTTPASSLSKFMTDTSCIQSSNSNVTIASMYGTSGDSAGTSTWLSQQYVALRDYFRHRKYRAIQADTCGAAEACSPGFDNWIPGSAGSTTQCNDNPPNFFPAMIQGYVNKVGNATSFPVATYDAGMPNPLYLQSLSGRGGYWSGQAAGLGTITGLLESEGYSWRIAPNGTPKKSRVSRLSVLVGGGTYSDTFLDYDVTAGGGLRLKSEITSGYTKDAFSTWSTVQRFRGTFYRPLAGDVLNRTGDVEGPCWVASATATACDSSNGTWPVTRFEYHPIGPASGKNSGRLYRVSTFAADAGMAPLVTQFSDYTEEGDPKQITDPNNVTTTLTYEGRKVKTQTRTVSGSIETTTWTYDDDQVAAITYPEGNSEVFCYRIGAASVFPSCAGTLTSKLRWKAKTAGLPAATTNWTERVEYTYDQNGFLTDEARFIPTERSPRYKRHINPDLHGRETFSKVGGLNGDQDFRMAAHFDGANNRDAYGPPMNLPPDYCKSAGAESALCWWYRYDRADRLNRANAPGSLSRTCFDYDAVGNIKGVTTGDATGGAAVSCNTSFNNPGQATAGVASSTDIQYTWDDFGNIVQVKNSGVDDAASSGTRYLYDAQGNVIEKQTAAMGSAYKQRFGYDGLGRLTRADSIQASDGGVQSLYQLDYDTSTGSPTGTLSNLKGRLSRRIDSYGDTWYSYDEAGRTKAEYRKRANCLTANRGALCEPHTLYAWDKNGNLTKITYPYGREVNYVYGSGGNRDRVTRVSAQVFLPTGVTTRNLLGEVAWEPYGGLRAYLTILNKGNVRSVEYFLGRRPESSLSAELCYGATSGDDGAVGPHDGSGRLRGLFVGTAKLNLNETTHVPGNILSQRYEWQEDQLASQKTCLAGTAGYQQNFAYDAMQRLTAETSVNTPHYQFDSSLGTTRVFDSRGNRTDGTRTGYNVWDFAYESVAKDRLAKVGWWYGFLNANDYFVKYDTTHNASGIVTKIEANKPLGGGPAKWTMDFGYSTSRATSDVFTSVAMDGNLIYDYYYDAFGRRRMKRDRFSNGTEFTYDLGHQLLIDQTWVDTDGYGSNLDEYVWLDGRPVVAFRGRVDGMGAHSAEFLDSPPGMACFRPGEGDLHCGAFHLVSNQQNFVLLALSDYDGKVASFALPDADGVINQSRFVSFGGSGTASPEVFDVPSGFTKDARFRTVYTGGWQTDWGWWGGVKEMSLSTPSGASSGIYPYGAEYGRMWSPRSPQMTGNDTVTWSISCSTDCASAADMLEWRVWESGAPRFNTRLRFPGQYHDAETDFYENWNRFYDPTTGRYLSSEPMLQNSEFSRQSSRSGMALPAYSYALNNPIGYFDPDGFRVISIKGDQLATDAIKDLRSTCRGETLYRYMDSLPVDWVIKSGITTSLDKFSWGETSRSGGKITTVLDDFLHSRSTNMDGSSGYVMGRHPGWTLKHELGHALLLSIWYPRRGQDPTIKSHHDFSEEIRRQLTSEPDCCSGSTGCCK